MIRRALPILLAAALFAGCRTAPVEWSPVPADDLRSQALLAAQAERREARRGLRAGARVRISGQSGGAFAREILLLERPARLRVEVMGPIGQRVAVLTSDGEQYALWRAETNRLERGPVHPHILQEVAGIPLRPEQAVALLLGTPALPDGPPDAVRSSPQGALRLVWEAGGIARIAEFDAAGRLRGWRIGRGEGAAGDWLRTRWTAFPSARDGLARRVELEFPGLERSAEVELEDVELNPTLPARLFRLELPGRAGASS